MSYAPAVNSVHRSLMRLLTVLMTILVVCCGDSTPTVDAARETFLKEPARMGGFTLNDLINAGLVRLNRFEKTNGVTGVSSGTKTYRLEYRAELEVIDSFKVKEYPSFGTQVVREKGNSEIFVLGTPSVPEESVGRITRSFQKGKIWQTNGQKVFELTENGWR